MTIGAVIALSITPNNGVVNKGQTLAFTATATLSDNSTVDVSSQVTWSVDDTSKMVISLGGVATGVSAGVISLMASYPAASPTDPPVIAIVPVTVADAVVLAPQFRSALLQNLLNYFDDQDPRVRQGRYTIDAQLLNLCAQSMEDLGLRINREKDRSFHSVPLGIDNRGVYQGARVPPGVTFQDELSDRPLVSVVGYRGLVPTVLDPYDDRLPIPARVELDFDRQSFALVDPVIADWIGAAGSDDGVFVTYSDSLGTLPVANQITFWLDQLGFQSANVDILIEGEVYPQPAWYAQRSKTTESLRLTEEGWAITRWRWQVIDTITIRNLPTSARLRGWLLPFALPAVPDPARPYFHPDYRDQPKSRFWQADGSNLLLREVYAAGRDAGMSDNQVYVTPEAINDAAVEPWTYGLYAVSDGQLYYIDRREPMPEQLKVTGLVTEPLLGIDVSYDDDKSGVNHYAVVTPIAYARAAEVFQYRYLFEDPVGNIFVVLPDSTLAVYTGSAGWRPGTPQEFSLLLPSPGTYVFTLECRDTTGLTSSDKVPYLYAELTAKKAFSLEQIVPQAKAICYDSWERLWLWTGSYAVPIQVHYDAYVADRGQQRIFFTDSFDQVVVS